MLPARRHDLLIEPMEDESVAYDAVRFRAHCLNRTAHRVYLPGEYHVRPHEMHCVPRQNPAVALR